jgi:hypothetical protein
VLGVTRQAVFLRSGHPIDSAQAMAAAWAQVTGMIGA